MSAAEAPKSEQIQANVAAALSRLRGELGAASSPVASATPIPMPKTSSEPVQPEPMPAPEGPSLGPLPAGPVRLSEAERAAPPASGVTSGLRPFEPTLNAAVGNPPSNDTEPPRMEPRMEEAPKPDLFGRLRADPSLATDRAAAAAAGEAKPDSQPDLLSGMEVPPAPPPPLGSFSAEDEVNGRGRRMRNRLLVLAAVIVIAGGAVWAWIASHREAEGPVPVIAADATPEKVKPVDEGGMQVPNQNVEILNGQPSAEAQPETVLPPPEQPVAPPTGETTDQASAAPQAPAVTDAPAPAAPSVTAPAIPSVSAPEPGETAAMPAPAAAAPEPQTQAAEPAPAEPAPAEAPKAETTQTAAAPAAAAPAAPSVAPTANGGARVQLAAVKSEALAQSQWAKMQKAHPELLGALTLNVEKVEKNGSTFYRIQAGPLTKAQAKDLCAKLKAQKQDCIVAK